MSEITDVLKNQRIWPGPQEVADRLECPDWLRGWLRNAPWGIPAQAKAQGKTVYDLLKGEATADFRRIYALYLHLAYIDLIVGAWSEKTGNPRKEASFPEAYRYWTSYVWTWLGRVPRWHKEGWGDPDAQAKRKWIEAAEIPWGGFPSA